MKYGLYDQTFKIAADYDLFLRLFKNGVKSMYIEEVLAWFRTGGISSVDATRVREENYLVRKRYNPFIAWIVEKILYRRSRLEKS